MSPTPSTKFAPPPPLVALASWVLPGLGYVVLGQRKRGVTVGLTILLLLALGLLIGGVRVMEVPGYGDSGGPLSVVRDTSSSRDTVEENAEARSGRVILGSVLRVQPMAELRDKPWSIAQVLSGPAAVAGMAWSNYAADPANGPGGTEALAAPSHARVNEIGVLYTAVAGMLNLLAVIDAASRAEQLRSDRAAADEG